MSKLIPKSISKFQKFENEKNCPEITLFWFSSLRFLSVSIAMDDKTQNTLLFQTIKKSLIHKKKN